MLQWTARRSTLCLFMSSSPSALFREHFYDVLSRLPDGFYKLSFFSDCHGGLIAMLIFCSNNVNNFHVIFLFSYLTFICRSQQTHFPNPKNYILSNCLALLLNILFRSCSSSVARKTDTIENACETNG